jgi:hypothetical protein
MTLSTRIASAEVGSRELDIELMVLLGGALDVGDGVYYGPNEAVWHTSDAAEVDGSYHMLPSPSRSLDAALALAERVLPRWGYDIGSPSRMGEHGGRPWADCWPPVEDDDVRTFRLRPTPYHINAATPALALCAAILKAVESEK